MKVKGLRGVCVGVDDALKEGEERDLDPATADYLVNIGAAEVVVEEVPPPGPTSDQEASAAAAAASGTETVPA